MTQLVELQGALHKFREAGIKVYAVSYDEVGALAEFADHHNIAFTLLSDKGSKVIRHYGIHNHFVTRDQVPFFGIPFPGIYLVNERGVITEKFFNRNLSHRDSAEAIIDSALGEILLSNDEPNASTDIDDIRISATYHGGGGNLKGAVVRQLVVRFDMRPGLYICDDPVPEGMVATHIEVSGPEGLNFDEIIKPPTVTRRAKDSNLTLRVWEGQADFVFGVWCDDRIAGFVEEPKFDEVEISVKIICQVSEESIRRIPQVESLTLKVPIEKYVGHELPGKMPGANITTMDSMKYMKRLIRRGLLRSPIKGYVYLKNRIRDLQTGPLK